MGNGNWWENVNGERVGYKKQAHIAAQRGSKVALNLFIGSSVAQRRRQLEYANADGNEPLQLRLSY